MKPRNYTYFTGDFETTVYDGQDYTEVWASALVPFYSEDVRVDNSIDDFFNYLFGLRQNVCVYFHNLKFDGEFILYYLLTKRNFEQAFDGKPENGFVRDSKMWNRSLKYCISFKGMWYNIILKYRGCFIEFRDSLKLLPMSVKKIGDSFGTKHHKSTIEYKGVRYAGGEIKPDEKEYIANDVLVPKEALEIMFEQGHKKLTIGSCCLAEYKQIFEQENKAFEFDEVFPNLFEKELPGEYGDNSIGSYILRSYKGAICLLAEGKENRIFKNGLTLDVNSLYPYVMHSDSGNYYPVGYPVCWTGNYIPDEAKIDNRYYFIRCRTRFYLKEGKLPFIQIKGNYLYPPTKHLATSDVYNKKTKQYEPYYVDRNGNQLPANVELTLTMTDYEIIKEQYNLVDFEILSGMWFYTKIGLFDTYIDKYKQIKMNSKGAVRNIAKLFSTNLYGKFAASDNSSFKTAYIKDDLTLGLTIQEEYDKKPGYIPIGSAITSYARKHSFTVAQQNYYGPDKPGFIYCDTDSIHIDLPFEQIKGVKVHEAEYGAWKAEASWDVGIFARQKTYIEHVVAENFEPVEESYYNIKCAGMPDRCKELFKVSLGTPLKYSEAAKEYNEAELKFLFHENKKFHKRDLTDFKVGLIVPGKLYPKHIIGGIVLEEGLYTMH